MTLKLHHTHMGTSGEALFIIHGVYGSGDNWASLGRAFSKKFSVYLLDMRNHGRSPWSENFNYPVMAEDLIAFARDQGIDKFHLIGHSMGGKVAMQVACVAPELLLGLVVIDMAPKSYEVSSHRGLLKAMNKLQPEYFHSRKDLDKALQSDISDFAIRQFLLKNIKRDELKQFAWKLNLKIISENIEHIGSYIPPFSNEIHTKALFIKGNNSDYIANLEYSLIARIFPFASIINIFNAGHWVHADQPKALYNYVDTFLENL